MVNIIALQYNPCKTQIEIVSLSVFTELVRICLRILNPLITLFIAVIRFSALAEINRVTHIFSNLKSIIYALVGITVFSLILYIPFMIGIQIQNSSNNCFYYKYDNSVISSHFRKWYTFVFSLIMCILITIVSVLMLRILYKAKQRANTLNVSSSQENMKTASYVILAIVFLSIFTLILLSIVTLIVDIVFHIQSSNKGSVIVVYCMCLVLLYTNNVVNIFIHCKREEFRQTLRQLLFPCRRVGETREVEDIEMNQASPPE